MTYPLANVSAPIANTGSAPPYFNGSLSNSSTSSKGSIRPVADFIAQEKIHTERQQAFFTALNKILPTTQSPAAKISPLVKFLMTPPEQFGSEEKIKKMLYKPEGYLKRFFGNESWKDWSEDRTDLGYAVGNMLGILETGPGRSVEEFVQTLDLQRLENANQAAELFLKELAPVAVSAKSKIIKREIDVESDVLVRARRETPTLEAVGPAVEKVRPQSSPQLTALLTNSLRVTIDQWPDNNGYYYGQAFNYTDSLGNQKVGSAFQLFAYKSGDASVLGLTNSRFVVAAWKSVGYNSYGEMFRSIGIQVFDIVGSSTPQKVGAEIYIENAETVAREIEAPIMIWLSDSEFLVGFNYYDSDGTGWSGGCGRNCNYYEQTFELINGSSQSRPTWVIPVAAIGGFLGLIGIASIVRCCLQDRRQQDNYPTARERGPQREREETNAPPAKRTSEPPALETITRRREPEAAARKASPLPYDQDLEWQARVAKRKRIEDTFEEAKQALDAARQIYEKQSKSYDKLIREVRDRQVTWENGDEAYYRNMRYKDEEVDRLKGELKKNVEKPFTQARRAFDQAKENYKAEKFW